MSWVSQLGEFVRLLGTLTFFMRHVTNYTTIDHLTVEVKRKPLVNSRRVEQNKCVIFLLPHKYLIIVCFFMNDAPIMWESNIRGVCLSFLESC